MIYTEYKPKRGRRKEITEPFNEIAKYAVEHGLKPYEYGKAVARRGG